ncbi:recombinase family protein [Kribbella sp. NPDC050820]|uniref:recombinase family protein n=1 Tax=Kribbella sp. NPDC050820 TaxID=3155408 RepID=UPI0033F1FFDE
MTTELKPSELLTAEPAAATDIRIGYARSSTARPALDSQLDALAQVGVTRVFSEKISTRATRRPELEAAVALAHEIRGSGVSGSRSSSTNTNASVAASTWLPWPKGSRRTTSGWSSSPAN